MQVRLAYRGQSSMRGDSRRSELHLLPNLAREPVSFDAGFEGLQSAVRFREAISALHDVVINDLRYKPRDKTAYEEWLKSEKEREANFRAQAYKQATQEILARQADVPLDLMERFESSRSKYWGARQKYSDYLYKHDQELWRLLMPCDPIVTVAEDVLFFECFSADESSYGCLTVERGMFGASTHERRGTTNVEYSWSLYNHFQQLRSYRESRFKIDPEGFEVAVAGSEDYREEKIDLPAGWLRGLMQVQAAMTMPMRRVRLTRDAMYSLLAWIKRHKARTSPRALRFELTPGQAPRMVVEPWEQPITSHGTKYDGSPCDGRAGGDPIRIWGTRRLLSLARLLPLVDHVDVYLLGSGMPSFWVAQMGEMRLTLGLSGWTANDWTRGAALDLLSPPVWPSAGLVTGVASQLQTKRTAALDDPGLRGVASQAECAAALNHLARVGQVIYDLSAGVYRWRQIMPSAVGEADLGPEPEELVASRALVRAGGVRLTGKQSLADGGTLLQGTWEKVDLELVIDADARMKSAKCLCKPFRKGGLRMGPCRHLLALRELGEGRDQKQLSLDEWFRRWQRWSKN
jgi:hypothetical protein